MSVYAFIYGAFALKYSGLCVRKLFGRLPRGLQARLFNLGHFAAAALCYWKLGLVRTPDLMISDVLMKSTAQSSEVSYDKSIE